MDPESVDVTAGLGGFLAFFILAVALFFLMRNMNARMRRMAYREELEAKAAQDAEPEPGEPETGEPETGESPQGPESPDSPAVDDDSGPDEP